MNATNSGLKRLRVGWQKEVVLEFYLTRHFDAYDALLLDACLSMTYGPAWTEQAVRHVPRDLYPRMPPAQLEDVMFHFNPLRFPRSSTLTTPERYVVTHMTGVDFRVLYNGEALVKYRPDREETDY